MNLYLATFNLQKSSYMEDSSQEPGPQMIRLIKAEFMGDAEDLLRKEVERYDRYGTSYSIINLDISACIQD